MPENNPSSPTPRPFKFPTESIGEQIRREREARRMSRKELAYRTGVALNTLTRWELDYRSPRLRNLRRLEQVLGIDFGERREPVEIVGHGEDLTAPPLILPLLGEASEPHRPRAISPDLLVSLTHLRRDLDSIIKSVVDRTAL